MVDIGKNTDKKIKGRHKDLKEFIQVWEKFRSIYRKVLSEREISPAHEALLQDTISVICRKVSFMSEAYGLLPQEKDLLDRACAKIFSLKSLSNVSDEVLEDINYTWETLYVFLQKKDVEWDQEALLKEKKKGVFQWNIRR